MAIFNYDAALVEMGGDDEIFEAVAETYLEDSVDTLAALNDAFVNNDSEAVCRHAHSLKSSSRTVGGEDAGMVAEKLEFETKTGDLSSAKGLIDELEKQINILKSALNEKGYSI